MNGPILVTGAAGFIGINLCLELHKRGYAFVATDIRPPPLAFPDFRAVDLLDRAAVTALVHEVSPTVVIHLGARTDLRGRTSSDYAVNTTGLSNLMDALGPVRPRPRLIAASSRLVFRIGHTPRHSWDYSPVNAYGQSKVKGEMLLRARDPREFPWIIVRPTSIWGPWFGTPYRLFFDAVHQRRYVHPRGRRIRKSFGFVGNIVDQLIAFAQVSPTAVVGRAFFLADMEPIEVGTFAEAIADASGVPRPLRAPVSLLRCAAWLGDGWESLRLASAAPLTTFRLDNLLTEMIYDLEPTRRVTGPPTYTLSQGLSATLAWLRSHPE